MTDLLNIVELNKHIKVLFKKDNQWYYQDGNQSLCLELRESEDEFFELNTQFVKISVGIIINTDYLQDCVIDQQNAYVIVANTKYDIHDTYISKLKTIQRKKQKSKNALVKGGWLSKRNNKQPEKSLDMLIDVNNIKYMLREGSSTCAYYNGEQTKRFYETLIYFERNLDANIPLVRIDRHCLVNIKYIESFKINSQTKSGEVCIDKHFFKISRRQLGQFREKIKMSDLVFLMKKAV